MSFVVTAARASAIAESNWAYVRAARARRNSLTLDQQFSIGEKSGEVRGQVDECRPYSFNSLTDTSNFVGRQVIHDDTGSRPEVGYQYLFHISFKS